MGMKGRASDDFKINEDNDDEKEEIDLFNNKRRQSQSIEGSRRATLGLPDNGVGLTKDYYNINRPMSITSLVDLIVMRRTGNEDRGKRRSSRLSKDLDERIKQTLAWKELEDELNKEDVMVNFRKKMREMRKEARQSIPKESKIERKINEDRRIQLRTSLLEPHNQRLSTTESIKEAIQEFKTRQPAIIEETKEVEKRYEEEDDNEATDIIQKTRELLQQMGYLKTVNLQSNIKERPVIDRQPLTPTSSQLSSASIRKRKRASRSGSEKSLNVNAKSRSKNLSVTSSKPYTPTRTTDSSKKNTPRSSASSRNSTATKPGSSRRSDSRPTPTKQSTRPQIPTSRPSVDKSKKVSTGQAKAPFSQRS